jgi:hypothetical protein
VFYFELIWVTFKPIWNYFVLLFNVIHSMQFLKKQSENFMVIIFNLFYIDVPWNFEHPNAQRLKLHAPEIRRDEKHNKWRGGSCRPPLKDERIKQPIAGLATAEKGFSLSLVSYSAQRAWISRPFLSTQTDFRPGRICRSDCGKLITTEKPVRERDGGGKTQSLATV